MDILYAQFGTIPNAILRVIACVTGGSDWLSVYESLTYLNDIALAALIAYILFMFFAVMNIVTAIYIEHAVKAGAADSDHVLKEELANDDKFVEEMKALFVDADEDGSGDITFEELCGFLEDKGVRARLKILGLEVHEACGLYRLLDV